MEADYLKISLPAPPENKKLHPIGTDLYSE
jgi:hypothetical protein